MKQSLFFLLTSTALALVCAASATAQETTGVPGSPSATTTIDGKQLPPPDPKFGRVIKEKAWESKSWWPPRVVPPKGAPNVLLIMTDESGFRRAEHLGGVIIPLLQWIASRIPGCVTRTSTRHIVVLPDAGGDHHGAQPSLRSALGSSAKYRRDFRVTTRSFHSKKRHHRYHPEGKRVRDFVVRQRPQHALFPVSSQAGPFEQWPNGMGFEYFYGAASKLTVDSSFRRVQCGACVYARLDIDKPKTDARTVEPADQNRGSLHPRRASRSCPRDIAFV